MEAAKRLPPQRELSAARLTEDKLLYWGVCYCGGRVYLPPSAAADGPPLLRKEAREGVLECS